MEWTPGEVRLNNILDRIDATLDGLCPCGGTPREGSTYCSDDCVPTWRARDTVSDLDGTAMRWAPNMPADWPPRVRIDPEPMIRAARDIARLFADVAEALKPIAERLGRFFAAANTPTVEPDHPLARMKARRANLTYGPAHPTRPPRNLGIRR
jgi:hypothetical protein